MAEAEEEIAATAPTVEGPAGGGPNWLKPTLILTTLVALVVTIALIWSFIAKDAVFSRDFQIRAQTSANKGAVAVDRVLGRIQRETQDLAMALADGKDVEPAIGRALAANPAITAMG